MVETFTLDELFGRSDLLPTFSGKEDYPDGFVQAQDARFKGNLSEFLRELRKSGNTTGVYRLCKITTSRQGTPVYAELCSFDETPTGFSSSIKRLETSLKVAKRNELRDHNLAFLRMYSEGDVDKKITCTLSGQQLDAWEFESGSPINIWEQHHFKVKNRASVQKEGTDPGAILKTFDFWEPSGKTVDGIKDMMRTIFLSPTMHKAVHNTWPDSDIDNYLVDHRPWALRSQENWDVWIGWLSHKGYSPELFGDYDSWIASLRF